jgi:hypothetical protein
MQFGTALFVAGLIATSVTAWAAVSTPRYLISLKISEGDRVRYEPRLVTTPEEAATLRIRDGKESLEVIAFGRTDGRFSINATLLQWTVGGMVGSDQAVTLASDGETSTITLDKPDAETGAAGTMRIEISIKPVAE